MLSMQCAACGESVVVDEDLGASQPCPSCGRPVGTLPAEARPQSTALDDLQEDGSPIRFGAYSKAAEAQWDDPTASYVDEQVSSLVKDEAVIDNAVVNAVPPEIEAKFRARQREARKKLIGIGVLVLLALAALVVIIIN